MLRFLATVTFVCFNTSIFAAPAMAATKPDMDHMVAQAVQTYNAGVARYTVNGAEAMFDHPDMKKTFRDQDKKDFVEFKKGLSPLPTARADGQIIYLKAPNREIKIEVVNLEKGLFKVDGNEVTYDASKGLGPNFPGLKEALEKSNKKNGLTYLLDLGTQTAEAKGNSALMLGLVGGLGLMLGVLVGTLVIPMFTSPSTQTNHQ